MHLPASSRAHCWGYELGGGGLGAAWVQGKAGAAAVAASNPGVSEAGSGRSQTEGGEHLPLPHTGFSQHASVTLMSQPLGLPAFAAPYCTQHLYARSVCTHIQVFFFQFLQWVPGNLCFNKKQQKKTKTFL